MGIGFGAVRSLIYPVQWYRNLNIPNHCVVRKFPRQYVGELSVIQHGLSEKLAESLIN